MNFNNFSKDERKVIEGRLGEALVYEMLVGDGDKQVRMSEDRYDSQKDMTYGDELVEVKTQLRFFTKDGFMIRQNQWRKLDLCDRLYFVEVPRFLDQPIKIFWAERKHDPATYTVETFKGEQVRVYKVSGLSLVREIVDPIDVRLLNAVCPSTYTNQH